MSHAYRHKTKIYLMLFLGYAAAATKLFYKETCDRCLMELNMRGQEEQVQGIHAFAVSYQTEKKKKVCP